MTTSSARNAAVTYSLLFKAWQSAAGVVGIVVIARYFDPVSQGFYYTFASLIALQSFFELGLYLVISVSASHEWAKLRLASDGRIDGDRDAHSRLVSLGRFVFKWYGVAAVLFLCLASAFGLAFLGRNSSPGLDWKTPWLLHVIFSAASMWLAPFLSLLEGCDQMASTSRFRLLQSILSSLAFWIGVAAGLSLWAVPLLSLVSLLMLLCYLLLVRKAFFLPFFSKPDGAVFSWRTELLPMQWRLALQGLFSYLSFPLYTSLSFAYLGASEAGRVGMTLQIVHAVQSVSLVLVSTKAPQYAMAVADSNRGRLDQEWGRATRRSLLLMALLNLSLLLALILALRDEWPVAGRVLSPLAFALLSTGSLAALSIQCMAIYLRAHKQERLTPVGVSAGLLYGLVAWACVPVFGAVGIASSYLLITACIAFPLTLFVFRASRREWGRPQKSGPVSPVHE